MKFSLINIKRVAFVPFCLFWVSFFSAQAQDSIIIEERNFPMAPEKVTVNNIFIIGNEKTRKNVILREMDISTGITYDWEDFVTLVSGDQQKIYNLQLFNAVEVTPLFTGDEQAEILVSVKERWYVIPSIIFTLADRNFSEWWINQNRDFSRVNYGLKLNHANVGGRNEKLRVAGQLGFTQAFDLNYVKPYIDKNQLHGLSVGFTYLTNKTIAIRSSGNRQIFYTNEEEEVLRKILNTSLTYTYRGSFYNFHYLSFGYSRTDIHEDVLLQNPNYFIHGNNKLRYFYAAYSFKHDRRDNVAYATDGELLSIGLIRYGLFANDDINETEISLLANKYQPLTDKFHIVSGLSASSFLSPLQPYTLVRGIGYRPDFIRGYELNVIDGQQLLVHKSSLRYELLNLAFDLSAVMPLDEFSIFPVKAYISANFDHGYVRDRNKLPENAMLTNTYLFGYGMGLDLVTFYDQVFRFEYSINNTGVGSFFINVRAPL